MECEAADGKALYSDADSGVPVDVAFEVLSFAEDEGTGSQACAVVGCAGSRGGAFILFLGIDEMGCACRTSFYPGVSHEL